MSQWLGFEKTRLTWDELRSREIVETLPRMRAGGAPRGLYGLSLSIIDNMSKRRSGTLKLDLQTRESKQRLALYSLQEGWNILGNFDQSMMKRCAQSTRKHQVQLVVQKLC